MWARIPKLLPMKKVRLCSKKLHKDYIQYDCYVNKSLYPIIEWTRPICMRKTTEYK